MSVGDSGANPSRMLMDNSPMRYIFPVLEWLDLKATNDRYWDMEWLDPYTPLPIVQ